LAIFCSVALAVGLACPIANADINTESRESVESAYINVFAPTLEVPNGWTGSVATCNPGTQSAQFQKATLDAVNFYRALAGVDPATENVAQSAIARKAALILEANKKVEHDRKGMPRCSTPEGIETLPGGASGEIVESVNVGAAGIGGYIDDPGTHNAEVGHRNIVLNPKNTSFGFGTTATYNVSHSYRASGSATTPEFVPWPSANFFPSQLIPSSGRWNIVSNGAASLAGASVSVKKNGEPLETSVEFQSAGKPKNLVWKLKQGFAAPTGTAVDTYDVAISGITGGSTATYSYTVKVFNVPAVTLSASSLSGTWRAGSTVTVNLGGISPSGAAVTSYSWQTRVDFNSPATVVGTGSTYTVKPEDGGKLLALSVVIKKTGYAPLLKTIGDVWYKLPGLNVSVNVAGSAAVGRVLTGSVSAKDSISGASVGKSVKYQWLRNGKAISKATGASYKLTNSDIGRSITLRATVTPTDARYTAKTVVSAAKSIAKLKSSVKVDNIKKLKKNKTGKAKVTVTVNTIRPQGTIKLYVGAKQVGQASLSAAKKGKVTVKFAKFSKKGTYKLKAVYVDSTGQINGSSSKLATVKVK
jgi:uncharacterized protein YkwD